MREVGGMTARLHEGPIVYWNPHQAHGFVLDGDERLFFRHHDDCRLAPARGMSVAFHRVVDSRTKQTIATGLRVPRNKKAAPISEAASFTHRLP